MSATQSKPSPYYCPECRERKDHATPVNTSHSSTGDSGCPDCLSNELAPVVEEAGDSRTVSGGYIPPAERDDAVELGDL